MSVEYVIGVSGVVIAVLSYRWHRQGRNLDWRREAYEKLATWAAIADYEVGLVGVAFVIYPDGPAHPNVLRAIVDADLRQPPTSVVTSVRLHGTRRVVDLLDEACHAVGRLDMQRQITFPADTIDLAVAEALDAIREGREYEPPDGQNLYQLMSDAETALAKLTAAVSRELHPRWRWSEPRVRLTGV